MSPQMQTTSSAVAAASAPYPAMAAIPAVPFYKLPYDVRRILWDLIHHEEHQVRSATITLTEGSEFVGRNLGPDLYPNEFILQLSPPEDNLEALVPMFFPRESKDQEWLQKFITHSRKRILGGPNILFVGEVAEILQPFMSQIAARQKRYEVSCTENRGRDDNTNSWVLSKIVPKISVGSASEVKHLAIYANKPDLSTHRQYLDNALFEMLHCMPALEMLYLVLDMRFNPNIPHPTNQTFVGGMTGILGANGSGLPTTAPNDEDRELRDKMLRTYQRASRIKSGILTRLRDRNRSTDFWRPHGLKADDPAKPVFQINIVQWSG